MNGANSLFGVLQYFLIIAISLSAAQEDSPCPGVFRYQYDDDINNVYGIIEAPVPNDNSNVYKLEVQLSVGNSVQGFNGNIQLGRPKSQVISDLQNGKPLTYRVYFPRWIKTPPRVTQISINGNQICFGYPFEKNSVPLITTIHLQHTLTISTPLWMSGGGGGGFTQNNWNSVPSFGFSNVDKTPSQIDVHFLTESPLKNVQLPSPIDFNPQLPKDPSRLYPWNPFFNNNNNNNIVNNNDDNNQNTRRFDLDSSFLQNSNPATTWFLNGVNSNNNFNSFFHTNNNGNSASGSGSNNGNHFNPFATTGNTGNNFNAILNTGGNKNNYNPFTNNNGGNGNTFTFNPFLTNRGVSSTPTPDVDLSVNNPLPTLTPKDSEVEDLPTVESNLVKKSPPETNDACGTSVVTNALLIHGNSFRNGIHPWLAAIFLQNNDGGLIFICGSSLISHKHIVTAAHCVQKKKRKLKPDELWIVLGRENIQRWSGDDAKIIQAEQTYIHPEHQSHTADADIAVILLSEEVSFTSLIKPVCLWTGDSDVNLIVERTGTVIGWGKDESGKVSPEPKQLTFPVVGEDVCLRSHPGFDKITSNRTFCAGFRNNSGPCNGDSGGGFLIFARRKWFLRGVVSMSLLGPDGNCDLNQYVVFTDVAKYVDWILSIIN